GGRAHGESQCKKAQRKRPTHARAAHRDTQRTLSVLQCVPGSTFVEGLALQRVLVGQSPKGLGHLLLGGLAALIRHWEAPNARRGNRPAERSAALASRCVRLPGAPGAWRWTRTHPRLRQCPRLACSRVSATRRRLARLGSALPRSARVAAGPLWLSDHPARLHARLHAASR